ncbi:MAG: lytic transglycosylase domain-containing protein [Candidatus Peribacteria bacterium]|nr:lytic transglycosylase domain-containing protein [Candidatus Peribacteria bacterium]
MPEQPKNSNNIFPTQKSNDNLAMRVYSLNIKYIDAHRDFRKAQGKIENIPKLKEIFNGDFSFEYLLPIFIKETLLTHSNISSSGAIGYGQLTNTAITEIYRQYPSLKLLNLKKENPIDNIILSYIYHKFIVTKYVKNIIQKYNINLTPPEFQYFVHFAYNAGIGTLTELLQKSNAKTLLDFQKYCAKKL